MQKYVSHLDLTKHNSGSTVRIYIYQYTIKAVGDKGTEVT